MNINQRTTGKHHNVPMTDERLWGPYVHYTYSASTGIGNESKAVLSFESLLGRQIPSPRWESTCIHGVTYEHFGGVVCIEI